MITTLILAGGKGERLWPLSTPECPKPFLSLFGGKTLLQETVDRHRGERCVVVTSGRHLSMARAQVECEVIAEPCARGTVPALFWAMRGMALDDVVCLCPSDHVMGELGLVAIE